MNAPIRILGLDPGLRRTGWGVIDCAGTRISHVAHGVIAPKDTLPFSERLLCLFTGIEAVLNAYGPHEAAVEETFMNNNAQSALKLGQQTATLRHLHRVADQTKPRDVGQGVDAGLIRQQSANRVELGRRADQGLVAGGVQPVLLERRAQDADPERLRQDQDVTDLTGAIGQDAIRVDQTQGH